jgi:hypothetical protein
MKGPPFAGAGLGPVTAEDELPVPAGSSRGPDNGWQPDDEGHLRPVAYARSKLSAAEQNYLAHVLEPLAVARAPRAPRSGALPAQAGQRGASAGGMLVRVGVVRRCRGAVNVDSEAAPRVRRVP